MFNAASKTNRHWFSFSISGLCLWTSCPSKVLSALLCSKKWIQSPQGPVKRLEDTLWLQIRTGARHRRRNGCENCGITQGRKAGARISATSAPVIIVTLPVHIPSTLPGYKSQPLCTVMAQNREAAQWTVHVAGPSKSHRPKLYQPWQRWSSSATPLSCWNWRGYWDEKPEIRVAFISSLARCPQKPDIAIKLFLQKY